jgi:ketosteroid isomerase-like protein
MKRIILCVAMMLGFAKSDPGQNAEAAESASERGVTEGVLVREVLEVKRLYDVAQLKNDGAWFRRAFAADYVWIGPNGEVVPKAEYIRDLDSRDLTWESVEARDTEVRVYGDTAIATGRFFGKGHFKGAPLDERQRFTSVLIKRGGRWQVISEHCSKLNP